MRAERGRRMFEVVAVLAVLALLVVLVVLVVRIPVGVLLTHLRHVR